MFRSKEIKCVSKSKSKDLSFILDVSTIPGYEMKNGRTIKQTMIVLDEHFN